MKGLLNLYDNVSTAKYECSIHVELELHHSRIKCLSVHGS